MLKENRCFAHQAIALVGLQWHYKAMTCNESSSPQDKWPSSSRMQQRVGTLPLTNIEVEIVVYSKFGPSSIGA